LAISDKVKEKTWNSRSPYPSDSQVKRDILNFIIESSCGKAPEVFLMNYDLNQWTSAISAVLEEFGGRLLPQEALNGIVTLEKLKKDQKKCGYGIYELWMTMTKHLQNIARICNNFDNQNYLANDITRTLLKKIHLVGDDYDRIERKVVRLLQLSIAPEVDENKSSYPKKLPKPSPVGGKKQAKDDSDNDIYYDALTDSEVIEQASNNSNSVKLNSSKPKSELRKDAIDEDEFDF
jgi:hypothetical protein